jgi:membrane protein
VAKLRLFPKRLPAPLRIFVAAFKAWNADNAPRLGAALAYYTLFALAPMLLVALRVASVFYDEASVRTEMMGQVESLLGTAGAQLVESLLQSTLTSQATLFATIVGGVTFFLGATGAFLQLQGALNTIWKVKPKPRNSLVGFVFDRLRSFGLVVSIGFLLMVSLVVSTGLAAMAGWVGRTMPGAPIFWVVVNTMVSLAVITLLFAAVYRLLPDVKLRWRDVWTGAIITAILFTIGKQLIGLYLGRTSPASAYGAAGSVVVLLLWVFYSAQIVLLGAEITRIVVRTTRPPPPAEAFAEKKP